MAELESDNVFPELHLFPRLEKVAAVGRFIGERLGLCGDDVPYSGGAATLDRELYDNPNQMELF